MVCYTTDKQMGYPCEINVVDSRNFNPDETVFKVAIPTGGPKVTIPSILLFNNSAYSCLMKGVSKIQMPLTFFVGHIDGVEWVGRPAADWTRQW